jgi:formate hydrogenlyase subunit 4
MVTRRRWVPTALDAPLMVAASAAARFNALAVVALVLVWAYLAWSYGRLVGRRIRSWQHHRWSAAVTLSLVLVWLVVRNIFFAPFSALHV